MTILEKRMSCEIETPSTGANGMLLLVMDRKWMENQGYHVFVSFVVNVSLTLSRFRVEKVKKVRLTEASTYLILSIFGRLYAISKLSAALAA